MSVQMEMNDCMMTLSIAALSSETETEMNFLGIQAE